MGNLTISVMGVIAILTMSFLSYFGADDQLTGAVVGIMGTVAYKSIDALAGDALPWKKGKQPDEGDDDGD